MGLAKPGETSGLTGIGPGLAHQESAGQVFGQYWNRTDRFLQFKSGPLAGYPDPLLTLGPTQTIAKFAVCVVNKPEPSTRVQFDGKLPTRLNWSGWQPVAQRVHPEIQLRLLLLEYVNSILSKLCFHQTRICFCMLCSLQYRLIWNRCYTF